MLLLLLACPEPPPVANVNVVGPDQGQAAAEAPPTPPPVTAGGPRLDALELPEKVPFRARIRTNPATIVDQGGQVLVVIEAIGVEVRVLELKPDRAQIECTGCRAPVTGWVQRSYLWVGTEPADGPNDRLLAWLESQRGLAPVAANGFIEAGGVWIAPPWYAEVGTEIADLRLVADGKSWKIKSE